MKNNIDPEKSEAAVQTSRRVVLIGGAPRSGTTILCDILNEHQDIAIWAEYPFDKLIRELSVLLEYGEEQTRDLSSEWISANLAAGLGAGDPGDQRSHVETARNGIYHMHGNRGLTHPRRFPLADQFPAIVSTVVATAVGKRETQIIGSKDPLFFLHSDMDLVLRHYPDVRFMLCIRAPVDQINSSANRRNRAQMGLDQWAAKSVAEMAADYIEVVRNIVAYAARFGDRVIIVKYEDLLADAPVVLRTIEAFFNIAAGTLPDIVSSNSHNRSILTTDEQVTLARLFVDTPADWEAMPLTGTGLAAADQLAPLLYAALEPTGHVRYDVANERRCLGHGWGDAEETGRWSIGEAAELVFAVRAPGLRLIALDIAANLPFISARIRCRILLNDTILFDGFICEGRPVGGSDIGVIPLRGGLFDTVTLGPVYIGSGRLNVLRFQFPGVRSPLSLGTGGDPRRLAIKLRQFGLVDFTKTD